MLIGWDFYQKKNLSKKFDTIIKEASIVRRLSRPAT